MVVPFGGGPQDARRMLHNLDLLRLGRPASEDERGAASDQLIVADNTMHGGVEAPLATVVPARGERSSYHARNAGARIARSDWILFLDADCAPVPDLLDAYFREPIAERCGAVAGPIVGAREQGAFLARYARSRNFLDHDHGLLRSSSGLAPAGNLLVRRAAFEELGGFMEGIRSGGDVDLCRRLRAAGWALERRERAVVEHRHREGAIEFLAMIARYGGGSRWLNERHPGSSPRWPLARGLGESLVDAAKLAARRRFEEALFRAVDGLGLIAHNTGYATGNRTSRRIS